jgi:hypothetical protein
MQTFKLAGLGSGELGWVLLKSFCRSGSEFFEFDFAGDVPPREFATGRGPSC